MKVLVKLFATFRENRFKTEEWELNEGTPVGDVLQRLNIAPKEVQILLVNGHDASDSVLLKEGDTLSLFPPVGGG